MEVSNFDPVISWLKKKNSSCRLSHEVQFDLDNGPLIIRTNSKDLIRNSEEIFCHYSGISKDNAPSESTVVEVYCVGSHSGTDGICLEAEWEARFPKLQFEISSETEFRGSFLYDSRQGLEFFWRPFDTMVSFHASPGTPIRVLIGNYEQKRGGSSTNLRYKTSDPPTFPQDIPDILDLIKILYIRNNRLFCLHAAAVAEDGAGILITGPSGMGKSTTALSLARDGFTLLSDELTLIKKTEREELEVSGLLIPPLLVGDTPCGIDDIEKSLASPAEYTKQALPLPDAWIKKSRGACVKPNVLLFLERPKQGNASHVLEKISSHEAFLGLMDQQLDLTTFFQQKDRVDTIVSVVNRCPAYRLTLGRDLKSLPDLVRSCINK